MSYIEIIIGTAALTVLLIYISRVESLSITNRTRIARLEDKELSRKLNAPKVQDLPTPDIGSIEYELQKAIEAHDNLYSDHKRLEKRTIKAEKDLELTRDALDEHKSELLRYSQENEKLKYDNSVLTLALKQASKTLKDNNLGTYYYAGVDMSEGKDISVKAYFNEKGEIIGADAIEPFVQEGGEIEGFESAKGIGTLYDNADKFEDKEPKVDYKFTATQCRECGKELGLNIEDAGSEREVKRKCQSCIDKECDYCDGIGQDYKICEVQGSEATVIECPKCKGSGKAPLVQKGSKPTPNYMYFWRSLSFSEMAHLRKKHRFNPTGELEPHEIEEIYNLENPKIDLI